MAEERKIVEVVRFNPYEKGSFLGFAVVRWENVAFSGVRVFKNKDDAVVVIGLILVYDVLILCSHGVFSVIAKNL